MVILTKKCPACGSLGEHEPDSPECRKKKERKTMTDIVCLSCGSPAMPHLPGAEMIKCQCGNELIVSLGEMCAETADCLRRQRTASNERERVLEAKNVRLTSAVKDIVNGASTNRGRCIDCDSVCVGSQCRSL